MKTDKQPCIYLVDASIYIFRAWFSLPESLTATDGTPVNAVYGFLRFLAQLFETSRPQHLMIAFDESLTTSYRNKIYPEYKANRESAPADLKAQFSVCQKLVESLGISYLRHPEYEADDLIASVAKVAKQNKYKIVVVTADKDLSQVIGSGDVWWDFMRDRRLDDQGIFETFGVWPHQMKDFLALTGDSVDNIPGVPGVGPKTATRLLRIFKDIDQLYNRLDEVSQLSLRGASRIAKDLKDHQERVLMARKLTRVSVEAPVGERSPDHRIGEADSKQLKELIEWMARGDGYLERIRTICAN